MPRVATELNDLADERTCRQLETLLNRVPRPRIVLLLERFEPLGDDFGRLVGEEETAVSFEHLQARGKVSRMLGLDGSNQAPSSATTQDPGVVEEAEDARLRSCARRGGTRPPASLRDLSA